MWTRQNNVHSFGIGCIQQSDKRTDIFMQHDNDENFSQLQELPLEEIFFSSRGK